MWHERTPRLIDATITALLFSRVRTGKLLLVKVMASPKKSSGKGNALAWPPPLPIRPKSVVQGS